MLSKVRIFKTWHILVQTYSKTYVFFNGKLRNDTGIVKRAQDCFLKIDFVIIYLMLKGLILILHVPLSLSVLLFIFNVKSHLSLQKGTIIATPNMKQGSVLNVYTHVQICLWKFPIGNVTKRPAHCDFSFSNSKDSFFRQPETIYSTTEWTGFKQLILGL